MKRFNDADLEVSLTAQQRQAINSESHAIVVLAGAGSGKTEVVARRVQRLLTLKDGVGRVLALSYTNKAAEELGERLRARVGAEAERVTTETIHGFAHSLIRQHSTRIGLPLEPEILTRDEDRVELLNQWLAGQGEGLAGDPLGHLRTIDICRARADETAEVEDWRRALRSLPALDYPALLDAAQELLSLRSVRRQLTRTYTHIVVDEAQNLTPSQYLLLTAMIGEPGGEGPAVMLVGDDKQSIISFAGADPDLINQFANAYNAETISLTVNFRSATMISEVAQRIANDLGQEQYDTEPHAAPGSIGVTYGADESDEASKVVDWIEDLLHNGLPSNAVAEKESVSVAEEDIAILGRSATALRETARVLGERDITYSTSIDAGDWLEGLAGKVVMEIIALNAAEQHVSTQWQLARLIDRDSEFLGSRNQIAAEIRSHSSPLIAALADLLDETDITQFIQRLGNQVPDDASAAELASWNADLGEIENAWRDYVDVTDRAHQTWADFRLFCSRRQRGSALEGVQLLTVHKSQGREFRAVAIVGMNEGQIPDFRAKSHVERASELRTFYVAVTRARRVLLLSRALRRTTRYGQRTTTPSPYLAFVRDLADGNPQPLT